MPWAVHARCADHKPMLRARARHLPVVLEMSCVGFGTQVVVVAGIMEFLGAVLLGAGVTSTIKCACLQV
jgi:hypothetical protein